jgi:uncharacterized MnhB-related membrane protein
MNPKRRTALATTVALSAVWAFMEMRHQSPPAALTQAIVAAAGTAFAFQKKEDGDAKET